MSEGLAKYFRDSVVKRPSAPEWKKEKFCSRKKMEIKTLVSKPGELPVIVTDKCYTPFIPAEIDDTDGNKIIANFARCAGCGVQRTRLIDFVCRMEDDEGNTVANQVQRVYCLIIVRWLNNCDRICFNASSVSPGFPVLSLHT